MDSLEQHHNTNLFAHLRNTTSTPPPSSSNIITAWADQLPTPPQAQIRSATSKPLVAISANRQRPPPDHNPKASAANKSLKRRARSPLRQDQPSKRTAVVSPEDTQTQRRSARLASLRAKMSAPNHSNQRGRATIYPTLDSTQEEEMEVASTAHPMATRARTGAMRGPPSTPNRPIVGSFNNHPIPPLPPTTPSGRSGSPGKSRPKSQSPSKDRPRSPSKTDTTSSSKDIIKKEQLAQMSPSTTFNRIGEVKDESVPKAVTHLWNKYMKSALYQDEVVPDELKAQLEEKFNTPMKTKGPISKYSYATKLYKVTEMPGVLETVGDVVEQASVQRDISHEPSWVSDIVTPIMTRLRKLESSVSSNGRGIEATNISSVLIAPPELCPTSLVDDFKDANKKVDYMLALNLTDKETRVLMTAPKRYRVAGGASINHTQHWTAFKAMFSYTEVKVDARDPLIQLAVWICAEFEKRSLEGYGLDLPIPAIATYGDHWKFWIAYMVKTPAKDQKLGEKPYSVQFLGPVGMGSTENAMGVFKIMHVLKAIVRWGLEVYEPQFMKHVFARYK
ncbi:MAG: hypothetical protein Q9184_006755 [Pyrenodesmia sp. 2 TL-2023]